MTQYKNVWCLVLIIFSGLFFTKCNTSNNPPPEQQSAHRELLTVAGTFSVDTTNSQIQWTGKKPTSSHTGTLKLSSGELQVHNGILTSGKFVMDMNSIVCTDITDPVDNIDFVEHMHDTDFFDTKNYPSVTFEIEEVRKAPEGNAYQIIGNLTIKKITQSITFSAMVKEEADMLLWTATFNVDRTRFALNYKSKTIFQGLGNKFIDDNIEIAVHLKARKNS